MKKAAGEEENAENAENTEAAEKPKKSAQRVTADGTYITQSALVTSSKKEDTSQPPLRGFLLDGEFFIGSVLATTLTKLGLKFAKVRFFGSKYKLFRTRPIIYFSYAMRQENKMPS